jgi:hypothetical protein
LCSWLLKVWAVLIHVMHVYVYYFGTLVQDMCAEHVLPLNICMCVLVFVRSVNRACCKYIRDQVRRCSQTEDDKGLDKVQEVYASLEIEYSKYIVPKTLPACGPARCCSYCCIIRTYIHCASYSSWLFRSW